MDCGMQDAKVTRKKRFLRGFFLVEVAIAMALVIGVTLTTTILMATIADQVQLATVVSLLDAAADREKAIMETLPPNLLADRGFVPDTTTATIPLGYKDNGSPEPYQTTVTRRAVVLSPTTMLVVAEFRATFRGTASNRDYVRSRQTVRSL